MVFLVSSVSSGEPMNGYQGNLINNRGTITGGKFADGSIVYNSGLITGGVFDTLSAIVGGAYTENETAYTSGAFIKNMMLQVLAKEQLFSKIPLFGERSLKIQTRIKT